MGNFGLRRSVTTAADPCYLLRVRYGLAPLTHVVLFDGNYYYYSFVFVAVEFIFSKKKLLLSPGNLDAYVSPR